VQVGAFTAGRNLEYGTESICSTLAVQQLPLANNRLHFRNRHANAAIWKSVSTGFQEGTTCTS
jgi:hypothetical protein